MARRKKYTSDTTDDTATGDEEVIEVDDDKYTALVAAVEHVLNKYKEGHIINGYDDYRYPGLKELAKALDGLRG